MIRRTAAVGLALHGLIHLIGLVSPWRIVTLEGFAYRTTVLGGAQDIGDVGVRLIGLAWLGLTFGFLAAGSGVWRGKPWAVGVTGALAVVSLIVSVAGLPETAADAAMTPPRVLSEGRPKAISGAPATTRSASMSAPPEAWSVVRASASGPNPAAIAWAIASVFPQWDS